MYQVFGYPRAITINSQERLHVKMYIYDAESYSIKWLEQYNEEEAKVWVEENNEWYEWVIKIVSTTTVVIV